MGWLVFFGFLAAFAVVLLWRLLGGKRRPGYAAIVEYWVYSRAERLPQTQALMDAMIARNPHNRPHKAAITQREGMLFTDLRLHIGLAKRDKNPQLFRPDLFEANAVPDKEALAGLAECTTLAKLQFVSQVPMSDGRHLQFMTHLASAMVRILRGSLVYDAVSEVFWTPEALSKELMRDNQVERFDVQARIVWNRAEQGFVAETLGLRKVGRRELRTSPQEPDEEVLVTTLLRQVAERLFADYGATFPMELEAHGGAFVVTSEGRDGRHERVKLSRKIQD